ncbi:MAG: HNH endonuclease [Methanobrevibacter sp.]|nr:HNH endonuclease [Methanobrevibacter sp.]
MKEYLYTNKKDNRVRLVIVDSNGRHTSKSYPRILMEKKLGRPLQSYEDVHHIDGNPSNNNISNLEIKIHGEHQKEHSLKYYDTIEICQICGKEFQMSKEKWQRFFSNMSRTKNKRRCLLTCSKSCAGKASSNKYPLMYKIENRLQELKF